MSDKPSAPATTHLVESVSALVYPPPPFTMLCCMCAMRETGVGPKNALRTYPARDQDIVVSLPTAPLGRYSQRQSLGSMIPDLIKDDSFILISGLSGPNDLDEESCSLIGCYGGRLMIPANSVRLSSCRKLFMNSTNFQQKFLDYLISIISSRSFPQCEYRLSSALLCTG
jgi:hypothetical protein